MRPRTTRSPFGRSGFSLVEVLVASAIFSLVLAGTTLVVMTSSSTATDSSARNRVRDLARRAADRVADELVNAGAATLFPDPEPDGTDNVVFATVTGVAAGVVGWSNPTRIAFEYDPGEVDDGVDNDGDGLVDEGRIVLTRNDGMAGQLRIVLCRDVRELLEGEDPNLADDNGNGLDDESGFWVQRAGELVIVRVTVEKAGPEGVLITGTSEASIRVLN
jgi:prepilin-type N-terminal cleavage/methylation domain-containing protein